jgi:hypothetical protein
VIRYGHLHRHLLAFHLHGRFYETIVSGTNVSDGALARCFRVDRRSGNSVANRLQVLHFAIGSFCIRQVVVVCGFAMPAGMPGMALVMVTSH